MRLKKCMRVLSLVVAIGVIASSFTGCQKNQAGGSLGGNLAIGNGGIAQGTPMDGSLNIDLGMFTVFGRPLGDWTYEELYDYICNNYEEDLGHDLTATINGVQYRPRVFKNPYDSTTVNVLEEFSNIVIQGFGVSYTLVKMEGCRSSWGLTAYNQMSGDLVSSICGQTPESYLETICPGLYEKLQEEDTISLKNGVVKKDSLDNGIDRIILGTLEGNLELGCEQGVITSLTLLYLDTWEVTTNVKDAMLGNTFAQDAGGLNLNLDQYKFMGKSFTSWNVTDLADYIRNTYELEFDDGDGFESYFIGNSGSGGNITVSMMPDGRESVGICLANDAIITIMEEPGVERVYMLDCGWNESARLDALGATELNALLDMTPRDYLESIQPGLYDKLLVEGKVVFENDMDIMQYVLLESDGSLRIQQGPISVNIGASQETGLIIRFSVSVNLRMW